MQKKPLVGFIGQGYIGKNYADDFEQRGFKVVRYALEAPYRGNKDRIKECDIVFIAVPTPTTPKGFDASIVRESMGLVGKGKIAVVKSTVIPGTTRDLQRRNPKIIVFNSPEFLTEKTASHDAAHPPMNIIGMVQNTPALRATAKKVLGVLPKAPLTLACRSEEAELIKYAHNTLSYTKLVFVNILYDLSRKLGADWDVVQKALKADPMVATPLNYHLAPVHKSGRGAGGHCFIKDFAALKALYGGTISDAEGNAVFSALERKNISLLRSSKKDLDLVRGVYGRSR